ncbi:low affinity iron permease family protein [Microtetraspora fusca]|uniref:Low affinity iron permease family protein n=1 Tax=Microtetraspora fusca TaxID=1997 RepID=A0ABW6VBJ2_MICFU
MKTRDRPLPTMPHPGDYSTAVTRFVGATTTALGSFPAIVAAVLLVALWVAGAALVPGGFGNELYELVLNTVTNIVTFVMVFIIQSSQNRDSRAIQAKLDAQTEVLAAMARNLDVRTEVPLTRFVGLEDAPDRAIRIEQQTLRERVVETEEVIQKSEADLGRAPEGRAGAADDAVETIERAKGSGGRQAPSGDQFPR